MAKHNETGLKGEQLAELFFHKNGYIIREKNWRFRRMEVDLIAEDDEWIVFAEVKTRRGTGYGYPEEAVTTAKQQFLKAAAEAYFETHQPQRKLCFDVISIILNHADEAVDFLHLPDAF